jgi:hypothetical protein
MLKNVKFSVLGFDDLVTMMYEADLAEETTRARL